MEKFEPKAYVCPSDPVPDEIPVYTFNGLAYMNDGRELIGIGSETLDTAVNRRPDHEGGRQVTLRVSYRGFCNLTVDFGGWNTGPTAVRRITEFARPNKIIQLTEIIPATQNEPTPSNQFPWICLSGAAPKDGFELLRKTFRYQSWKRHFGASNVLFFDGHVETLDPIALATTAATWQYHMVGGYGEKFRRGYRKIKPPGEQ